MLPCSLPARSLRCNSQISYQLAAAASLPELETFIGHWQLRYPYKVVWVNHAPVAAAAI